MNLNTNTMTKLIWTMSVGILSLNAFAQEGQNLISNSGFESVGKAPKRLGSIESAEGWVSPTGVRADLFTSSKLEDINVPENIVELEKEIEAVKNEKNKVVKSQRFEEAAALRDSEKKLQEESLRLEKLQTELNLRSEEVDELQRLINAKEAQMQQLKNAISNALHNFEGNGLTVVHKNGKIYVSMENKLLFDSGSWAVGSEGKKAVEQLAGVLSENKDINVLIEGHTDDVPYNGTTLIDNWDLSVKRATAIVRILKDKGVSPTQITAAGRSEFMPVDTNATTEGKAKNRRIEIILAPNLDEISKLLKE